MKIGAKIIEILIPVSSPTGFILIFREAVVTPSSNTTPINPPLASTSLYSSSQYNSLEYLTKDKEFEHIDIKSLVLEVVSIYKYQTNIKFDLDLDDDVYFEGYKENLFTVVSNIIDNGIRYAKTTIKIVLRKDRLRIYNDGEPIDSLFLNSMFKPYEKGSKGQFGLGMSIVKKTLDFFGLNLVVKNEEFGGVSFIITKD